MGRIFQGSVRAPESLAFCFSPCNANDSPKIPQKGGREEAQPRRAGGQIYWGEEKAEEGWGAEAGALGSPSDSGMSSWKYSAWRYCHKRRFPSHCRAEGGKKSGGAAHSQVQVLDMQSPP